MHLYHYRNINSAVAEIENTSFRMANRSELNDPIEGYLNIYWEGDKPAWEGLLRNYICSLYSSLDFCLTGCKDLKSYTVIPDIESLSDISFKQQCEAVSREFLYHSDVELTVDYLSHACRVSRAKTVYWLMLVHDLAFKLCVDELVKTGELGKGTSVKYKDNHDLIVKSVSLQMNAMDEQLIYDYVNKQISSNAQIIAGLVDERSKENVTSNFVLLQFDFPEMYVNRLADLVYPEMFVTSFSAENDNSVMWGNYADSHKGVCLEYEPLGENSFKLSSIPVESNEDGAEKTTTDIPISKVNYGGNVVSRNFFESMGRFTLKNVNQWLTGKDGKRSKLFNFENYNAWRERYWQDLKNVYNRKMPTWAYENEYRIIRDSMYAGYNEKAQTYKYDPSQLKSVIFGIKTSITDRAAIMDAVRKAYGSLDKVQWKQAEYDEMSQKISVSTIEFTAKYSRSFYE